ncbi:hypothetical protein GS399_03130 [Pedobacter sp. HMF7647]|uniref:YEATS-Like-Associating Three TM domain-containing protein n=1 Tax=Hufsiella arboris TaxID=2695275 RepID=A0A7K1Y6B3_9SPHI|nr:YEATS-associated helix-containing protein [Hufsiella arboris]MXV49951.1 hypothetical protein [Hufsiella arboris]
MDTHVVILISIMIVAGGFGGFLNYLHGFDTISVDKKGMPAGLRYTLLGIGSAFLVPAFLKMIASDLVNRHSSDVDYLIFAGFCLIAAIFSRRFIGTIGEKVLEAANSAKKAAEEAKKGLEATQNQVSSNAERIETVKLAVDLNTIQKDSFQANSSREDALQELVDTFISRTSIPDYAKRLKVKAELGRKMGEIIVRNNLPATDLLARNQSEGMLLALAYAVQLRPDENSLSILKNISGLATQLYTRYSILVSFDTLARNNFITKSEAQEIENIIKGFHKGADDSLLRKIEDSLNILRFILA